MLPAIRASSSISTCCTRRLTAWGLPTTTAPHGRRQPASSTVMYTGLMMVAALSLCGLTLRATMGQVHISAALAQCHASPLTSGYCCAYDPIPALGSMDHSLASVRRYTGLLLSRTEGVPSNMLVDSATRQLFVSDTGADRLVVVDVDSGYFSQVPCHRAFFFLPRATFPMVTHAQPTTPQPPAPPQAPAPSGVASAPHPSHSVPVLSPALCWLLGASSATLPSSTALFSYRTRNRDSRYTRLLRPRLRMRSGMVSPTRFEALCRGHRVSPSRPLPSTLDRTPPERFTLSTARRGG